MKGKMARETLIWNNFQRLFPEKVEHVLSYHKSGSKMIQLEMDDGLTLTFLYYDPSNWTLGTKVWRRKPEKPFIVKDAEKIKEG